MSASPNVRVTKWNLWDMEKAESLDWMLRTARFRRYEDSRYMCRVSMKKGLRVLEEDQRLQEVSRSVLKIENRLGGESRLDDNSLMCRHKAYLLQSRLWFVASGVEWEQPKFWRTLFLPSQSNESSSSQASILSKRPHLLQFGLNARFSTVDLDEATRV